MKYDKFAYAGVIWLPVAADETSHTYSNITVGSKTYTCTVTKTYDVEANKLIPATTP
jgi:hypothetical protein